MTGSGGYDPMKELRSVQRRLKDLFETALARTNFETSEGLDSWTPVADVYETDESLVVALEIPGVARDSIDVRIEGDELVVGGERSMDRDHSGEHFHRVERSYGSFERRFRLPSHVDRESVSAAFREGVLDVVVRVRAASAPAPRNITVE